MEELYLVRPVQADQSDVMKYRQEFFDEQDFVINGSGGLRDASSYEAWLTNIQDMEVEERLALEMVCASTYLVRRSRDHVLVGIVNIRHELNAHLLQFGGHVGYSIVKSERRKGYGKEMLRLALLQCDALGIHSVLVTCADTNVASRHTILANHGELENEVHHEGEVVQRYWIHR